MLQDIRDRITGKFALAILALIALPFVFFGINYNFVGLGYAAKVDGEEISVAQFENAYRNQLAALSEQGTEIPDQFRQLVREGVLDRMIREQLIAQYIAEHGYAVSDQMVTDFIQQEPTWQVDGAFSREAYYNWLELRAIDPAAFEASQRRALAQDQLQRGIAQTAFVTPSEYRRYLNLYGEERQVQLAEIDVSALSDSVAVSETEIEQYYEENADEFRSPESVDLAYVELRRDAIADDVDISEEELAEYYEQSKSRYVQDARRRASHILIPFGDDEDGAEEQARALMARAEAGEPFGDLAREYSGDSSTAEQGGDLGLLLEGQLPEQLGAAVFSMEEGGIQGPIRTDFGYHVVRLEDIQPGGPLPLEEVRAELERELALNKAEARYQNLERQLSDALFDADSVEDLAEATGLELQTASGFTRDGGEPFGSNQAAIDAVFDPIVLEDREISNIVELDANRAVVLAVTDYNEAATLPLGEVRETIESRMRSERAMELAAERADEIYAALESGEDAAAAAGEAPGVSTSTVSLTRQSADVAEAVRNAVFEMAKPADGTPRVGSVVTADRRYVVFKLTDVTPGRPESIPLAQRDQGKVQLGLQSGSQDFAALISHLEAQADIVKSEDVLAQETLFE